MKAIETIWKGWRFRSRTEARWAVFLEALGADFEYEPEGVELPSGRYLPDFRVQTFDWTPDYTWDGPEVRRSDLKPRRESVWLEVKGTHPTDTEIVRCSELAIASRQNVLLAVGSPKTEPQIYIFQHVPQLLDGEVEIETSMRWAMERPYYLAECSWRGGICLTSPVEWVPDPEDPAQLYPEGGQRWVGRLALGRPYEPMPQSWQPVFGPTMRAAYDAARSARFEFGQTDKRWSE